MTEQTDVERVARALYAEAQAEACKLEPSNPLVTYDEDDEESRLFCQRMATAAITAMDTALSAPSIFDLLEPLGKALVERGGPDIRGGFARGTGGVDIPFIVETLAARSEEVESLKHDLDRVRARESEYLNECERQRVRVRELEAALRNPPRHDFWGAGEPDCPREIKAGNGELHTLRCKVCGEDNPRNDICRAILTPQKEPTDGAQA